MKNNSSSKQCYNIQNIVLGVFFLVISNFCQSQDLIMDGPLPSTYTKKMLSIWDSINNYQYGVAATGFIGKDEFIGTCQAKSNDGGPWKPIDGYKHTICGYLSLKHGKVIEHYDDDYDIDLYVIPDPSFRWLQFKSKRPRGHYYDAFTLCCEVSMQEPGIRQLSMV